MWAYGRILLVILSVPILLSTLFFAPVWLFRKLSGKLRGVRHLSLRVVPLVGTVVLLMPLLLALLSGSSNKSATPNPVTVAWYVGTILFAILSGLGVVNLARLQTSTYDESHRFLLLCPRDSGHGHNNPDSRFFRAPRTSHLGILIRFQFQVSPIRYQMVCVICPPGR